MRCQWDGQEPHSERTKRVLLANCWPEFRHLGRHLELAWPWLRAEWRERHPVWREPELAWLRAGCPAGW